MATTLFVVKFLHIIAIATWFGHKLHLPSDIRGSLGAGLDAARAMLPRMQRAKKIGFGAGVLTLATGLTLIFLSGGFAAVPPRIHAGFTLTLLIFAVSAAGVGPTWKRVEEAVTGGDLATAQAKAKRMGMFFGIEHLLWTLTLATMVFKF